MGWKWIELTDEAHVETRDGKIGVTVCVEGHCGVMPVDADDDNADEVTE